MLIAAAHLVGLRLTWEEIPPPAHPTPASGPKPAPLGPKSVLSDPAAESPSAPMSAAPPAETEAITPGLLLPHLSNDVLARFLAHVGNLLDAARILGCPLAVLRQRASLGGISCPTVRQGAQQTVIDAFLASGDVRSVAASLQLPERAVRAQLRSCGLDTRKPRSKQVSKRKLKKAREQQIARRLGRGDTVAAVAQALGCSPDLVERVRRLRPAQIPSPYRNQPYVMHFKKCIKALPRILASAKTLAEVHAGLPYRINPAFIDRVIRAHYPGWWKGLLQRKERHRKMIVRQSRLESLWRLRTAMRQADIAPGELARRCGLSRAAVYMLLSGKVSTRKWDVLAQALGVSAAWLELGTKDAPLATDAPEPAPERAPAPEQEPTSEPTPEPVPEPAQVLAP
jgi:transcriptional regulator with XRE-family HTH domain/transposase-like protein